MYPGCIPGVHGWWTDVHYGCIMRCIQVYSGCPRNSTTRFEKRTPCALFGCTRRVHGAHQIPTPGVHPKVWYTLLRSAAWSGLISGARVARVQWVYNGVRPGNFREFGNSNPLNFHPLPESRFPEVRLPDPGSRIEFPFAIPTACDGPRRIEDRDERAVATHFATPTVASNANRRLPLTHNIFCIRPHYFV